MNNRVPKIVQKWVDNIKRTDPKSQTQFYSKKAVLLATFETMLLGREQIMGYMIKFLDKQDLKCRILENYTKIDEDRDTKIANGLYEFVYVENGKVEKVIARYTYVINKGRIITHHSSVNPE
tara:strand:- start:1787 stop:2152 length:366 start_codon:yes stop_codon:yes gene_type:complete